jgi:hypothetical protein
LAGYPHNLWITLWTEALSAAFSRATISFVRYWTKISRALKAIKNNMLWLRPEATKKKNVVGCAD